MSFLKKACSIAVAAALILTIFACVAYSTMAVGGPTVTVEDATVEVGDTAVVKVSFASNGSNVNGISFSVKYDNTKLTALEPLFSVSKDVYTVQNVNYAQDEVFVMLYSASAIADGDILNLKFNLNNNVVAGDTFTLTVNGCKFSDGKDISGNVENGSITVNSSVTYGDVDGNGSVDASDLVTLKSYFANYDYSTHTSTVAIETAASDVNGDGAIDANDLVWFKSYFANYDYETHTSTVVLGPQ